MRALLVLASNDSPPARLATPRRPKQEVAQGTTPDKKCFILFGQRPFGMKIKVEALDEKEEDQVREAGIGTQGDEGPSDYDDDETSDADSIYEEAKVPASNTCQTIPARGWMKTLVKKNIKEF